MAFAATVAWEVRTTGASTNGGGFDPTSGVPGVDYSQQDAAQVALTDMVIDAATNTIFSSATLGSSGNYVGNIINVTGGTGFTVQRVQIMSHSGGNYTCDKSLGTLASTGGTGNLGGGLAAFATIQPLPVAGNTVWVKAGTYTHTAAVAMVVGNTGSAAAGPVYWQGYDAARGDNTGTKPIITSATNSVNLFSYNACSYQYWKNIKFSHTAATRGAAFAGVTASATWWAFVDCIFDGLSNGLAGSSRGIDSMVLDNCLVMNCTSHGFHNGGANGLTRIMDSYFWNNTGSGFLQTSGTMYVVALNSIFAKNGGRGFYDDTTSRGQIHTFRNCTFADNTSSGLQIDVNTGSLSLTLENNVIYGNGVYGVNVPSYSAIKLKGHGLVNHHNFYGSNTSGNLNVVPAGAGDVTGLNDPFVTATASRTGTTPVNYGLNSTAGAGALARAAGFPGTINGQTASVGYIDGGAIQHQDSGGGGGLAHPVGRWM